MGDTRSAFTVLEKSVQALAPQGSRKCGKAMRKIDRAFAPLPAKNAVPLHSGDVDARTMLRVRCAVCPRKCKKALE